jgi:ribosomal protein S14
MPAKVLGDSLLDGTQRGRRHQAFRYCRQCVSLGHHSVTYQMFSENRSPAHQRKLEAQCHRCGRETPYILNASLVGSPYR